MITSLSRNELIKYTSLQVDTFFPDNHSIRNEIAMCISDTLDRVNTCFSKIIIPIFWENGDVLFNHLITDQYAMFLYILSNEVWKRTKEPSIAAKLMYLNKTLHSINCMYDTVLPPHFALIHCVGIVLGKAEYGDYFAALQGVTIGAQDGIYPKLQSNVTVYSHGSIVGKCTIGSNVKIGLNTHIYNMDIQDNSTCFTDINGALQIKPNSAPHNRQIWK